MDSISSYLSQRMGFFAAGRDQPAVDQPNNQAEDQPPQQLFSASLATIATYVANKFTFFGDLFWRIDGPLVS